MIGAAIVSASVVGAYAQDKTPVVDQRQQNQEKRIDQGVKSGELTKGEAAKLDVQQAKIQNDKVKAKSDGKVTKKERMKLKKEQNHASRTIARKKHNKQNGN